MDLNKEEDSGHSSGWKRDGQKEDGDFVSSEGSGFTPPPKREDRPVSRRGMASRQGALANDGTSTPAPSTARPSTTARGTPGPARAPTAASLASRASVPPGTASRLASAMRHSPLQQRLGTAIGLAGAQVTVVERPVTQQGLSGLRAASTAGGPRSALPQRQVQDKRYFEGLLQTKIRDLNAEMARLAKDIDAHTREQAAFLVYDKRVKDMAAQLTELQGQLADLNLVVDKLNTETEKGEVEAEWRELRRRNGQETLTLEQLFAQVQQRRQHAAQFEAEIEQERHMTDNLLRAMSPPLRERYAALQSANAGLQQRMDALQQTLDALDARRNALEDQLAVSQTKQEAVRLYHKLQEAEERKAALLEEEKNRATPAQEREQLLQRVKDDNAEMATMERQISELKDALTKKQEEMEQIEQDLDESQSERHQKYRELRRREETMEQFLSSFEDSKNQELARLTQLETQIVSALQQISKNLAHAGHLPSIDEFSVIKDNLSFKEGELEKSKNTVESLAKEHQQLQASLEKVEALEDKIKLEMETLRQKMASMTSEMTSLSDLDKLKQEADEKAAKLEKERTILEEKLGPSLEAVKEMQNQYDALKKQLEENETYAQLTNLERKLSQLEQNNFAIREYIESKRSETDYEPLKKKVYDLVQEYNSYLKEALK